MKFCITAVILVVTEMTHTAEDGASSAVCFRVGKALEERWVKFPDFAKLMQASHLLKMMPHDQSAFPLDMISPQTFDRIIQVNSLIHQKDALEQYLEQQTITDLVDLAKGADYLDCPKVFKKTMHTLITALLSKEGIDFFLGNSTALEILPAEVRTQLARLIARYMPCRRFAYDGGDEHTFDYTYTAALSADGKILAASTGWSVLFVSSTNTIIKQISIPWVKCIALDARGSQCVMSDQAGNIHYVVVTEPSCSFVTLSGTYPNIKQLCFNDTTNDLIVRTDNQTFALSIPDGQSVASFAAPPGSEVQKVSPGGHTTVFKKKTGGITFFFKSGTTQITYPEYDECIFFNNSGSRAVVYKKSTNDLYLLSIAKGRATQLMFPDEKSLDYVICGSISDYDSQIAMVVRLIKNRIYTTYLLVWNKNGRLAHRIRVHSWGEPTRICLLSDRLVIDRFSKSLLSPHNDSYHLMSIPLPDYKSLSPEQMLALIFLCDDKTIIDHPRIKTLYNSLPRELQSMVDLPLVKQLQAKAVSIVERLSLL